MDKFAGSIRAPLAVLRMLAALQGRSQGQRGHRRTRMGVRDRPYRSLPYPDRGQLGDLAVLELETCLDQKEFEQLDLSMADSTKDVPVGTLMTVSAQQDDNGRTQIVVQQGCKSLEATPVDGLFIADCAAVPGMSGSLVYEMGSDKKWHWTGVTTTGCAHHRPVRLNWAKLLKRVFDLDLEHCPNCGGELKIIAAILEQSVIEKILTHLGLQARAPPRSAARGQALQAA